MRQQGQVFELQTMGADGRRLWAYRYCAGGRGSRRVQRGGFASEQAAAEALARLPRERGLVEAPRVRELVNVYLAQHDGEPETVAKSIAPPADRLETRAARTPALRRASSKREKACSQVGRSLIGCSMWSVATLRVRRGARSRAL